MIDKDLFLQIIDMTPLVSIDLIIEDKKGKVLLGKRINKPAQGFWFVPGGRIRKNEKISDAFERISETELGASVFIEDAKLFGTYDHIYDDNFHGEQGINTHYVVLAYKVTLKDGAIDKEDIVTDDQHEEFRWWSVDDLLSDAEVHPNTKAYFKAG
jgi:colanic acid biosynthesis protein WcaH